MSQQDRIYCPPSRRGVWCSVYWIFKLTRYFLQAWFRLLSCVTFWLASVRSWATRISVRRLEYTCNSTTCASIDNTCGCAVARNFVALRHAVMTHYTPLEVKQLHYDMPLVHLHVRWSNWSSFVDDLLKEIEVDEHGNIAWQEFVKTLMSK